MTSGRPNPCSVTLAAATLFAAWAYPTEIPASEEGRALFTQQCMACHSYEKDGERRQGPNLWGLFERSLGGLPDFAYSKGLKADQRFWTPEILDQWLEEPKALSQDSYMMYRQADPEVRQHIIVFLETATTE